MTRENNKIITEENISEPISEKYLNFLQGLKNPKSYRNYIKSTKIYESCIAKYKDYLKSLELIEKKGPKTFKYECITKLCCEQFTEINEVGSARYTFKETMRLNEFNGLMEQLTVIKFVDKSFLIFENSLNTDAGIER